jgi:DNA-binding NtrC family response regulator
VVLGRASESDVRVDDPSVSRRHAVLHLGDPLRVEDLGGANGTFVRRPEQRTERGATQALRQLSGESVAIALGEPVSLGSAIIVVRRAPADAGGEAVAPGAAPAGRDVVVLDPAMRALHEQARLAAQSGLSVLLLGETGVGKEVLARSIHQWSPRAGRSFLGLNCAALSETLLESELFGHEKGAFTGATEARRGLLESVDGGTLFLDEVGDLPPSIQVKLLRVVEDRHVLRVGGRTPRRFDVRFVSATNRDLEADAARGAFRQDMFFRLNGIALTIPPLRARVSEIVPLARMFAERAARDLARPEPPVLAPAFAAALERHAWPGNIRELRNVIDRAVALALGRELTLDLLPAKLLATIPAPALAVAAAGIEERAPTLPPPAPRAALDEPGERERIILALEACAGNQTQAAARLGISRRTLVSRLETYNLPRPRKRD